ncbi:uncharacterized protein JCM15063_004295 [Sporobolomyces koalae]|uniref:uncharacterized protein n=1 Tax=Sporobolomyces koalae TaxID=500713 RepID=UPI003181F712
MVAMGEVGQLESRVQSIDPAIKLSVAIAAKVSTLHALKGRYTQPLAIEDLSSEPSAPPTAQAADSPSPQPAKDILAAQQQLDAEQERTKALMRDTIAQATHWLVSVCRHFEIELGSLPDNPDIDLKMPQALDSPADSETDDMNRRKTRDKLEFDIVWELCLVSLGLVGSASPGPEPPIQAQSTSKSGGFFSKGASRSTPESGAEKGAPAPLDYSALSRSLVVRAAEFFGIEEKTVFDVERAIAQFLFFQLQAQSDGDKPADGTLQWDEAASTYRTQQAKRGNTLKWAATGAGFVLGGVAIGLTGGLAAPALAPVLAGSLGIAAFGGASGAVLIGTLLGLGGDKTHRRMKGLENVSFVPVQDEHSRDLPQIPSLTATIVASGFLLDLAESSEAWVSTYSTEHGDTYALKADPITFLEGGKALDNFVKNKLISMGGVELIKRTALAAVYAGVALPLAIFNSTSLALDSEFSRCKDKAKKAGILLAEILEKEVHGKRPAVLVGYGPGASLIFSCLQELHRRELGHLVYSATLISLPEAPSAVAWANARSVIAHELVNVYSKNDWVLAVAARLFTLSSKIAGLGPINIDGLTNVDVSDLVQGHLEIRRKLPQILARVRERKDPKAQSPETAQPPLKDEVEGIERGLQAVTTAEVRDTASAKTSSPELAK